MVEGAVVIGSMSTEDKVEPVKKHGAALVLCNLKSDSLALHERFCNRRDDSGQILTNG